MAKKEKVKAPGFALDLSEEENVSVVPVSEIVENNEEKPRTEAKPRGEVRSCLRNEKVIVRHIPRQRGIVTDPKHVLYGGMAENAKRWFTVPRLTSGLFVNVLTDDEKNFLEQALGLEPNAMSIYRKKDNYWSDSNENSISRVVLKKDDNIFDLSTPEDYIRVKILLANKDDIAPSLKALQENRKTTYQFVVIREGEEVKEAKVKMDSTQRCYVEFGKIMEDADILRVVVEAISGKPVAPNAKLDWLQTQCNDMIQANSKLFLSVVTDELLQIKVLIKKAVEAGILAYRGNQLFMRDGNAPLCEYNEEPTLNTAAKYLINPKHQDILFAIQAKLKE